MTASTKRGRADLRRYLAGQHFVISVPMDPPEPVRSLESPRESVPMTRIDLVRELQTLADDVDELEAKLNTPHTQNFVEGVRREIAHQRERWGAKSDAGKTAADWFWLIGYLAGKALHAAIVGNKEKALHHCISTTAALANWHAAIASESNVMRPGIETPPGFDQ